MSCISINLHEYFVLSLHLLRFNFIKILNSNSNSCEDAMSHTLIRLRIHTQCMIRETYIYSQPFFRTIFLSIEINLVFKEKSKSIFKFVFSWVLGYCSGDDDDISRRVNTVNLLDKHVVILDGIFLRKSNI